MVNADESPGRRLLRRKAWTAIANGSAMTLAGLASVPLGIFWKPNLFGLLLLLPFGLWALNKGLKWRRDLLYRPDVDDGPWY